MNPVMHCPECRCPMLQGEQCVHFQGERQSGNELAVALVRFSADSRSPGRSPIFAVCAKVKAQWCPNPACTNHTIEILENKIQMEL